jgi:hypothetical protein
MKNHNLFAMTARIVFCLIVITGLSEFKLMAQVPPDTISRNDVINAPVTIQRKYVNNMPSSYVLSDLVNYPTGRDEDKYRDPALVYLTVDDFYNTLTSLQKLIVIMDPNTYMVALDASYIPTMVVGQ